MFRCLTLSLAAVLAMPAVVALADVRPVDLAALGGWNIVIDKDASPCEAYAAEEFRGFFGRASNIELPISKSPEGAGRHVLINIAKKASQLGPEDFRIVVGDDSISISGGGPRGTLYGVYTFLEDYLGVRFLTADHVHVPKLPAKAEVGPVDRTYHPPLLFRWTFYGETNRDPALAARLRVNTVDGDPKYGGKTGQLLIGHSFGSLIPISKYGQEHPEYFALRDGKRLSTGNDWYDTQPCLTNPEVLKIVTEAVLADVKAHPEQDNVVVGQNDNCQYCQCPACKAIDDREGTSMGSLLTFVNEVADAVGKEYPKVKVGTLSYQYTRKPPKTIKPRPNVQIQLCSIECCLAHPIEDPKCELNQRFCGDMAEWGKLTDQIFIWNYNTNFSNYLLPCPNLRVIGPNVHFFVRQGAKGIFMQGAGDQVGAELSELRNYMMAGLLWDPTRDGRKLMDEFLDLHYGKAAVPIRRFIDAYHDRVAAKGLHRNCYGGAANYMIDEDVARQALDAFAEALKLADDDAVKARVEKASICAYRAAINPAWAVPDGQTLTAEQAGSLRPLVKRFFELIAKYQVSGWAEGFPIEHAKQRLQANFGLKPGEEF